jgi:glycosyltransferase involved in cell wall biosynthesis
MTPHVSIGMPAYNAERTIRASIEALLAQTFGDFELIVSDNASTDGTWAVIEDCARRDPRIVAVRQDRNIGANANYSAVFRLARGRYFKWASSNDWCSPRFLEACVSHLEAHADVVLAQPRTRLFESAPESGADYDGDVAFDADDPVERFTAAATTMRLNNAMNGVVRADALRRTRLIEHYPGADVVLVGQLALMGRIALLPERLFHRRMDGATATRLMSAEAVQRHHYPTPTLRSLFPTWRFAAGWLRAVLSSGLPFADTCRGLQRVLRMIYWKRADLRRDLGEALRYPVRG